MFENIRHIETTTRGSAVITRCFVDNDFRDTVTFYTFMGRTIMCSQIYPPGSPSAYTLYDTLNGE